MDNDGIITCWNQAAERIFGYSSSEVFGENLQGMMVTPRFHEAVDQSLKQVQGQGGAATGANLEFVGIRKNGDEFPVELSLAAFELKGASHAVWLLRDITKRKKAEEDLLKAKADIEVASRAKTDFMNTISHELLTPMNGIVGFGALLNATDLTDKQQGYLNLVQKSSDRLMALISQLLNFANLETCEKDLHPDDFNIQDFFTSILAQFRPKAEEKGLQMTCEIADDIPAELHGDHVVIQQIISNILENAIKYSEHGFVAVRSSLKGSTDDGLILEVAIADSGCGISQANQTMIFEAFTQVEEYSTRKYQGVGIGLTIAARLVKLMSGEIWLESTESKGSTFYFTVRLPMQTLALANLINRIFANYSFFYREKAHFEFFKKNLLPEVTTRLQKRHSKDLRTWFAGCSTCEEPYTLVMLMLEYFGLNYHQWDAGVLATDRWQLQHS
ncbi:MAG: ATP-binding protein [Thermodesulfobacteriota bacterium]